MSIWLADWVLLRRATWRLAPTWLMNWSASAASRIATSQTRSSLPGNSSFSGKRGTAPSCITRLRIPCSVGSSGTAFKWSSSPREFGRASYSLKNRTPQALGGPKPASRGKNRFLPGALNGAPSRVSRSLGSAGAAAAAGVAEANVAAAAGLAAALEAIAASLQHLAALGVAAGAGDAAAVLGV